MSFFFGNVNNMCSFNSSGNVNISNIHMSNNNVSINGTQYKSVSKITIETTMEKVTLEDKFVDCSIHIEGDMTQPMTLSNSKVIVNGNANTINTSNGSIYVHGDCNGNASSSNGKIEIGGNVSGNASTSNANINIKGICSGRTSTSNGKVKK